jgi:hypothetical protein
MFTIITNEFRAVEPSAGIAKTERREIKRVDVIGHWCTGGV